MRALARLTLGIFLAAASCGRTPPAAGGNVREAIEDIWNRIQIVLILGDVTFVDGPTDSDKGQASLSDVGLYRALAENGTLIIGNERYVDDKSEILRSATVSAALTGKTQGTVERRPGHDRFLIPSGSYRVDSVSANERLTIGKASYRIVTGTHTVEPALEIWAAMQSRPGWLGRQRRFRVLLKLDAVSGKYTMEAMDLAERAKAISTSYVDARLAELRSAP